MILRGVRQVLSFTWSHLGLWSTNPVCLWFYLSCDNFSFQWTQPQFPQKLIFSANLGDRSTNPVHSWFYSLRGTCSLSDDETRGINPLIFFKHGSTQGRLQFKDLLSFKWFVWKSSCHVIEMQTLPLNSPQQNSSRHRNWKIIIGNRDSKKE
jgi:hypothetical protein